MNIMLIWPDVAEGMKEYLMLPSLEIPYISAVLKKNNHVVNLIDMRIDNLKPYELREHILKSFQDIFYIQGTVYNHCNVIKIIEELKKISPKSKIVLGGDVATTIPFNTIQRNPLLDFVIAYDVEYTLLNIIDTLKNNKFDNINNIAYRNENDKAVINAIDIPKFDLNELPMPDREIYSLDKYLKRDYETIITSSRGCPSTCSFCIRNKLYKFRFFSVERICSELESLQKAGFSSFFFIDDTFAFSDKRVKGFYEEIKKRNLKLRWACNIRLGDVNDYKLNLMKEIGVYRLFVGIETINKNSLNLVNKKVKVDEIKQKVELIKSFGIEVHTSFIVGSPGDTEEDLKITMEFVYNLSPTLVTFNKIKVLPGTELYDNPNKFNMIMPESWFEESRWSYETLIGTKELPPEIIDKWHKRMYCLLLKELL